MNWFKLEKGRLLNLDNVVSVPSSKEICEFVDCGQTIGVKLVGGIILPVTSLDAYRMRQMIANSIRD